MNVILLFFFHFCWNTGYPAAKTIINTKGILMFTIHYSDVLMARWRLKSPALPLFTQPFVQEEINENTKAPRRWHLCEEFTGDWWIPRTNVQ